jgi:hypothetical protein
MRLILVNLPVMFSNKVSRFNHVTLFCYSNFKIEISLF